MLFSYKDEDDFKSILSENSPDGIMHLGGDCDSNDENIQINIYDCRVGDFEKWEALMLDGKSPLKEINLRYGDDIPIFDTSFLNSITQFLKYFPKKGSKILNYVMNGPLLNIVNLNWKQIYNILLSNMPYSINIITSSLLINETKSLHHKLTFLEMNGFPFLFQYAKDPSLRLSLSLIFNCLSSYELSKYINGKNWKDQPEIIFRKDSKSDFLDSSSYCGINVKIEDDEEIEEGDDSAFSQFIEYLLTSENINVRINTLNALFFLSKNDDKLKGLIFCNVNSHTNLVQCDEELTLVLKILGNCLKSSITPMIFDLKNVIRKVNQVDNDSLNEAFISFINKIYKIENSEYIYSLGVVKKIVQIVTADSSFDVKKKALLILIKIANECDPNTFKKVIQENILCCLVDFLNIGIDYIVVGILNIIVKLIANWDFLKPPSDYFDIINSGKEIFEKLANSFDNNIKNLASRVLEFLSSDF